MNESYAVHNGVNIQNTGVMSMGLGVTNFRLSKQNFNTNISTEAELVGASIIFHIIYGTLCLCITRVT